MSKGNTELSRDERSIKAVWWPGEGDAGYRVGDPHSGDDTVMKIEPYDECGHMSHIPWIAVFGKNGIIARIPADHVSVHY